MTDYSQGWQAPWPVILLAMSMGLIPMSLLLLREGLIALKESWSWSSFGGFVLVMLILALIAALFGGGMGSTGMTGPIHYGG